MSDVMISVTELGGVSTDDARSALLVNGSLVSAHMVSGSAVLVAWTSSINAGVCKSDVASRSVG